MRIPGRIISRLLQHLLKRNLEAFTSLLSYTSVVTDFFVLHCFSFHICFSKLLPECVYAYVQILQTSKALNDVNLIFLLVLCTCTFALFCFNFPALLLLLFSPFSAWGALHLTFFFLRQIIVFYTLALWIAVFNTFQYIHLYIYVYMNLYVPFFWSSQTNVHHLENCCSIGTAAFLSIFLPFLTRCGEGRRRNKAEVCMIWQWGTLVFLWGTCVAYSQYWYVFFISFPFFILHTFPLEIASHYFLILSPLFFLIVFKARLRPRLSLSVSSLLSPPLCVCLFLYNCHSTPLLCWRLFQKSALACYTHTHTHTL